MYHDTELDSSFHEIELKSYVVSVYKVHFATWWVCMHLKTSSVKLVIVLCSPFLP